MPAPSGPQFAHLSDRQITSRIKSLNTRIDTLEGKFGGFIAREHNDVTPGGWWDKKESLMNKKQALRDELRTRKGE